MRTGSVAMVTLEDFLSTTDKFIVLDIDIYIQFWVEIREVH